jgi:hypothetical protein
MVADCTTRSFRRGRHDQYHNQRQSHHPLTSMGRRQTLIRRCWRHNPRGKNHPQCGLVAWLQKLSVIGQLRIVGAVTRSAAQCYRGQRRKIGRGHQGSGLGEFPRMQPRKTEKGATSNNCLQRIGNRELLKPCRRAIRGRAITVWPAVSTSLTGQDPIRKKIDIRMP